MLMARMRIMLIRMVGVTMMVMIMMIMMQASPLPIVLLCINRSARKLVLIPLTQVFAPPCQKVSFC